MDSALHHRIPNEIWRMIIGQLAGADTCAVRRLSKLFNGLATAATFHTVVLDANRVESLSDPDTAQKIWSVPQDSTAKQPEDDRKGSVAPYTAPHIAHHVRHLHLIGLQQKDLERLASHMKHLPSVNKVMFIAHEGTLASDEGAHYYLPLCETANLRRLVMQTPLRQPFLDYPHRLRTLEIGRLGSQCERLDIPALPELSSLALMSDLETGLYLHSLVLSQEKFPKLESLDLHYVTFDAARAVPKPMDNIQRLKLHFASFDGLDKLTAQLGRKATHASLGWRSLQSQSGGVDQRVSLPGVETLSLELGVVLGDAPQPCLVVDAKPYILSVTRHDAVDRENCGIAIERLYPDNLVEFFSHGMHWNYTWLRMLSESNSLQTLGFTGFPMQMGFWLCLRGLPWVRKILMEVGDESDELNSVPADAVFETMPLHLTSLYVKAPAIEREKFDRGVGVVRERLRQEYGFQADRRLRIRWQRLVADIVP